MSETLSQMFRPDTLSLTAVVLQVGAAFVLTLAIGLERFLRQKPIDFRPYVVISVGACALLIGAQELLASTVDDQSQIDPSRVIEGVITGIGFLGAGAMFREDGFVRGAGSAATIWASGAIGVLCGIGELWLACTVAGLILGLMIVSDPFTGNWDRPDKKD